MLKQWVPVGLVLSAFLVLGCSGENKTAQPSVPTTDATTVPVAMLQDEVVETACGECQFKMEGTSCDLAIRVDGKTYFVDGTKMADLGDAHAADGMCMVCRKAKVSGKVENGRFVATAFELLPMDEATQPEQTE